MKYVKSFLLTVASIAVILPAPVQAMGYFGGYPSSYPGYGYRPPVYPAYPVSQTNVSVNVNVNVRYAMPYGGGGCGSHGCVGGGYGGYGYGGYGYGYGRARWGHGGCGKHWYQGARCGFGRHCCKRKRARGFSLFVGVGPFQLAINTRRWSF